MSSGINKVILVGGVCKDPELRKAGATDVCTLRIATSERRKDGNDWKEHTEFHSVVCFGKTAENAAEYLKKGRQVYVEGRLQTRSYKDKEGHEKWVTEVKADVVNFLGGGDGRDGNRAGGL